MEKQCKKEDQRLTLKEEHYPCSLNLLLKLKGTCISLSLRWSSPATFTVSACADMLRLGAEVSTGTINCFNPAHALNKELQWDVRCVGLALALCPGANPFLSK